VALGRPIPAEIKRCYGPSDAPARSPGV
jgi:hypothetical protein